MEGNRGGRPPIGPRVVVRLTNTHRNQLRAAATRRGLAVPALLRTIIVEWLEEHT